MSEAMSIQSLNFKLKKIALQSGLPTVEAVFDGYDKVKIVLSTDGNYEGITRNYYVSVEELTRDYDFEWLFEAADALRRGEK